MPTSYLMQAATPAGELVTWLAIAPDWAAEHAPVLVSGVYADVALAGGGIETLDDVPSGAPDNAITLTDGSFVTLTDGSYATTA